MRFTVIATAVLLLTRAEVSSAQAARPGTTDTSHSHREYSLATLLAHASRQAPELMVAKAELGRWRAEERAASVLFPRDPSLQGSLGRRETSLGAGWDYSAGIAQEIEIAGQRAMRRRAAGDGLRVGYAELARARWHLHNRIRAAFYAALLAKERARAAQRFIRFAENVVAVARRRREAGEVAQVPVRLAEVELANAQQDAIAAAAAFRINRLALAELVGWSGEPPTPAGSLPAARPVSRPAELVALARASDVTLRVHGARKRWARSRVAAAKREGWPNPELGFAYEREARAGTEAAADIWQARLSVPLPLWSANLPERARARAELEVVHAEQASRVRSLPARVLRSVAAVNASAARVALFARQIVPNLEKTLGSLERAFEMGEITITDVLIARERFLRSQSAMLDAYADYFRAKAELDLDVGREAY